jgi:hypothetical protein
MSLQLAVFVFGAILFLVGLVGHVRAKEIEIGTTSSVVRGFSFVLGLLAIVISFMLPSKTEQNTRFQTQPQVATKSDHPIIGDDLTADATYIYWTKALELDKYYDPKLKAMLEEVKLAQANLFNLEPVFNDELVMRYETVSEKNRGVAELMWERIRREQAISVLNVDNELVELFAKGRDMGNRFAKTYAETAGILGAIAKVGVNAETLKKYQSVTSEQQFLGAEAQQYIKDYDALRIKLTQKYNKEFPTIRQ